MVILANSPKSQLHKCPQLKLPLTRPGQKQVLFLALLVGSFLIALKSMLVSSFIHTQVPLNSDELLEPQQLMGAEPQGHICTQLPMDPSSYAIYAYIGRCQNCRREIAIIQTTGRQPQVGILT